MRIGLRRFDLVAENQLYFLAVTEIIYRYGLKREDPL